MMDSHDLTNLETLARRALYDSEDDERDTLATLAMTLHLVSANKISRDGRRDLEETLRRVAPELLLALRALDQVCGPIARRKRTILRRRQP